MLMVNYLVPKVYNSGAWKVNSGLQGQDKRWLGCTKNKIFCTVKNFVFLANFCLHFFELLIIKKVSRQMQASIKAAVRWH